MLQSACQVATFLQIVSLLLALFALLHRYDAGLRLCLLPASGYLICTSDGVKSLKETLNGGGSFITVIASSGILCSGVLGVISVGLCSGVSVILSTHSYHTTSSSSCSLSGVISTQATPEQSTVETQTVNYSLYTVKKMGRNKIKQSDATVQTSPQGDVLTQAEDTNTKDFSKTSALPKPNTLEVASLHIWLVHHFVRFCVVTDHQ